MHTYTSTYTGLLIWFKHNRFSHFIGAACPVILLNQNNFDTDSLLISYIYRHEFVISLFLQAFAQKCIAFDLSVVREKFDYHTHFIQLFLVRHVISAWPDVKMQAKRSILSTHRGRERDNRMKHVYWAIFLHMRFFWQCTFVCLSLVLVCSAPIERCWERATVWCVLLCVPYWTLNGVRWLESFTN